MNSVAVCRGGEPIEHFLAGVAVADDEENGVGVAVEAGGDRFCEEEQVFLAGEAAGVTDDPGVLGDAGGGAEPRTIATGEERDVDACGDGGDRGGDASFVQQ